MRRPTIPHVTTARRIVVWLEWGKRETSMFGVASAFGEDRAQRCTVLVSVRTFFLIGRRRWRLKLLLW